MSCAEHSSQGCCACWAHALGSRALGQHQHHARAFCAEWNKSSRELSLCSRSGVWGDGRDESVEPSKVLTITFPWQSQAAAAAPYRWADEQRGPGLSQRMFRKRFSLPALLLYPPHSKDTWPILALFTLEGNNSPKPPLPSIRDAHISQSELLQRPHSWWQQAQNVHTVSFLVVFLSLWQNTAFQLQPLPSSASASRSSGQSVSSCPSGRRGIICWSQHPCSTPSQVRGGLLTFLHLVHRTTQRNLR